MTSTQTSFQCYTTATDRSVTNKLLNAIKGEGYLVSVFDGEEWVISRSCDIKAIKAELAATDHDCIKVSTKGKEIIGTFVMIWNNGEESPVSDYTVSDVMENLYQQAH